VPLAEPACSSSNNVIPATGKPDYAALFDMHMMCWGTGRERSEQEYAVLLGDSGWRFDATTYPSFRAIGVVAASRSAETNAE
jgi:hypothetical protein